MSTQFISERRNYIVRSTTNDMEPQYNCKLLFSLYFDFCIGQDFAGLPRTGVLDSETKRLMKTPRCGVKDQVGLTDEVQFKVNRRRTKRYVHQGSRWSIKTLTYRITKYPASSYGLTKSEIDLEIKRAFQIWSDKTELRFRRRYTGSVHIEIRFERKESDDQFQILISP